MRALLVIFSLSLFGLGAALLTTGWSDLVLLFGPCVLASGLLLVQQFVRQDQVEIVKPRRVTARKAWVVIDGSNVMYWNAGTPSLDPIKQVIRVLARHGLTAGVMFDANAGYKLFGAYGNDERFAQELGLPEDHIMVVPKGTPADPYILTAARDLRARIVSNDRFRDWQRYYPEIQTPGHVISGTCKGNKVLLDLRG